MADYDINEQKYVKARKGKSGKLHRCTGCFCDIPEGTMVWKSHFLCDGKFWDSFECDFCLNFLDYLDDSDGYEEGYTLEYLYEVYDSEENLLGDIECAKMLPGQKEMLIETWREAKKRHDERKERFLKDIETEEQTK